MRHPRRRGGPGIRYLIRRREFLGAGIGLALWPLSFPSRAAAGSLPESTESALVTSPYVYVSPLRADGSESTCHAELWFGWIDGSVVVNVASDRWKARSLERGLDTVRIWVGDFGRWKGILGTNDSFRQGPSFDARAEFLRDPAVLDRHLALYEEKYPGEIGRWRDPMRSGVKDGSRVLIGYHPL